MRIFLPVLFSLIAVPALAQSALAQSKMVEVHDRAAMPGFSINADVADDLDVFNQAGQKIGEVEEVVGSTRETPEALVVDFEDQVVDYGPEDRIIPLSAFTFDGSGMVMADGITATEMPRWRD